MSALAGGQLRAQTGCRPRSWVSFGQDFIDASRVIRAAIQRLADAKKRRRPRPISGCSGKPSPEISEYVRNLIVGKLVDQMTQFIAAGSHGGNTTAAAALRRLSRTIAWTSNTAPPERGIGASLAKAGQPVRQATAAARLRFLGSTPRRRPASQSAPAESGSHRDLMASAAPCSLPDETRRAP
ncbi:MAG: hypothetical protein LBQ06_00455 [Frankiaceae bacterium]|jgi:hypothetical protein|nr:hypothetical protein [Frankiaceae bacterium]